jgi:hypothetical protein
MKEFYSIDTLYLSWADIAVQLIVYLKEIIHKFKLNFTFESEYTVKI